MLRSMWHSRVLQHILEHAHATGVTLGYVKSLELDGLGVIDERWEQRVDASGATFVLVHLDDLLFEAQRAQIADADVAFATAVLQ